MLRKFDILVAVRKMFRSPEKLELDDKRERSMRRVFLESEPDEKGEPESHEMSYPIFSESFNDKEDSSKLQEHLNLLLEEGDFMRILRYSQKLLVEKGVTEAEDLDCTDPAVALALSEAINLSAKSIDYRFYKLKPAVIIAAWKMGAHFGYNSDDESYSLYDPRIGTASFHDPNGEVSTIITNILDEQKPKWSHEWSGVIRQGLAFEVLASLKRLQRLKEIDALLLRLILETTPKELQNPETGSYSGKRDLNLVELERPGILGEKYGTDSTCVKLRDIILLSEDEELKALFLGLGKDHLKKEGNEDINTN